MVHSLFGHFYHFKSAYKIVEDEFKEPFLQRIVNKADSTKTLPESRLNREWQDLIKDIEGPSLDFLQLNIAPVSLLFSLLCAVDGRHDDLSLPYYETHRS